MDRTELTARQDICCAQCGQSVPGYDTVNYGSLEKGYRQLCSGCFNSEVARSNGLDKFQHVTFNPVEIADCTGATHLFHFRTHLFGAGVALDAFELHDGDPAGYRFEVIGAPEDDPMALLARLIVKIRRALSVMHLQDGEFGLQLANHYAVRGAIESDPADDDRLPLLVIDGREIPWQEFGRMLMTYEGFQFQLEIRDPSEEFFNTA